MFDILEEKSKTLSKLGSFYYSTITNKDVNLAHRLSHVAYNSGLFHQFRNIYNNVANQQYTDLINKVITFQDSDIKFGTFEIGNKAANYIPDLDQITLLPDELQGNVSKLRLDDDVSLAYILNVPKNIYIKIIRLDDGTTLFNGLNFKSKYGQIILRTNPIHLFKGMQFFVLSYQQRDRNILCYPLGVQDVYGSINHIIDYYRNNQSLSAFKKALYQAVGIPVVEDYCTIMSIVNLTTGVSYITSSGVCYDADFPHQQLQVGDSLTKGTIIGGEEILKIYLPGDEIPQSIKSVKLNNLSIAGGADLIIPNSEGRLFIDNIFQPNNFVYGDGVQYYINYINSIGTTTKPTELVPDSMNRVEFLRNVLAPSRCVIIDMDKENIPYDMAMKLKSFIIDHSPIGAVFAFSDEESPIEPPTPTIVTIDGELTKGQTQDSYRGLYHAFAFNLSESDGIITWNKQIDSDSDITINNIVLTTPTVSSDKTTSPARLALYQADEARFIAVSDDVEWNINTTCTFTFGEDAKVKFTDRLMFVFVHPNTPQEQLINPVDIGLSVEDDNFTLAAWYIKVRSDGTAQSYPPNWGVITSASLNTTNRQYLPMFTIQIQQTV